MMAECSDQRFKNMIHSYELDLLPEKDRQEFELHLFECEECRNSMLLFEAAADHLRNSPRVHELLNKIDEEKKELQVSPEEKEKPGTGYKGFWSKLLPASVVTLIILAFLLFKPWKFEFEPTQEAIAQENRLIVMSFENLADDSDKEKLGKIISNLLTTDLSESQYIQVVSSQHLYDILKLLGKKDFDVFDKDIATEIALEAAAKWMLQGSILQVKPNLIITIQLVDVSTGDVVMSRRVEAGFDEDMFAMVDRLTVDIKNSLSLPSAAYDEFDPAIADVTTHSQKAYQYYLEGVEYINKLYYDEAKQSYSMAVQHDSTFATAYYCLAWFGDSSALAKAIEYSDRATRKERLYIKALAAYRSDKITQYKDYLNEIIVNYPDEKEAMFDLAAVLKAQNEKDEAIKYFKKALEVDPQYKIAYNELAYLYFESGDIDGALAEVNKYIEIAPDEPNPYDSRAEIYAMLGNLDLAIESSEIAFNLKPDFFDYSTALDLGRLHIFKGNYNRAEELFRYAVINGASRIRSVARTHMVFIPLYQGKFTEALEVIDDCLAADRMESADSTGSDGCPWKHYLKGRINFELGNLQTALEELKMADEIYHNNNPDPEYAFSSAQAFFLARKGDYVGAKNVAEKTLTDTEKMKADNNPYKRIMARIEFAKGNYKKSIEGLNKVTGQKAVDLEDRFLLGRAYLAEARFSEAIAVFEDLLADYINKWRLLEAYWSVKTHFYLGQAYELSGQTDKAIGQYREFLDIWSNSDPGIPEKEDAELRLLRLKGRS